MKSLFVLFGCLLFVLAITSSDAAKKVKKEDPVVPVDQEEEEEEQPNQPEGEQPDQPDLPEGEQPTNPEETPKDELTPPKNDTGSSEQGSLKKAKNKDKKDKKGKGKKKQPMFADDTEDQSIEKIGDAIEELTVEPIDFTASTTDRSDGGADADPGDSTGSTTAATDGGSDGSDGFSATTDATSSTDSTSSTDATSSTDSTSSTDATESTSVTDTTGSSTEVEDEPEWSRWSECSVSCGGGLRFRFRKIRDPRDLSPRDEPALTEESQPCCLGICPCDCAVSEWGAWCSCSVSCGPGTRSRRRYIITPSLFGAPPCSVPLQETEPCQNNVEWSPTHDTPAPYGNSRRNCDEPTKHCRIAGSSGFVPSQPQSNY